MHGDYKIDNDNLGPGGRPRLLAIVD